MWKRKKSGTEEESTKEENETNECDDNKCEENKRFDLKFRNSKVRFCQNFDKVFTNIFGFPVGDLKNFEKFVKLLYRPTDPSSLGVARALFGLCMVIDIVHERGLSDIDEKWGDPRICRFPLIHGMEPPTLPWMTILYTIMWLGAFGIMLGYHFKFACFCFVLPYWYIFLLDKTFWNNHSYLYGIVAVLFWGTDASKYFSLDSKRNQKDEKVPLWNYFILRFQFFLLYFLAGLKKTDSDWLSGYSVVTLSGHWVFLPFTIILTPEKTNHLIVHLFGFIFDLTIGFWMMFDKTRVVAMIFCTAFHLMNTRLFSIGMFPYTCLATMPLFCHVDWPRKFEKWTNFDSYFIVKSFCKTLINAFKKASRKIKCKRDFNKNNTGNDNIKNNGSIQNNDNNAQNEGIKSQENKQETKTESLKCSEENSSTSRSSNEDSSIDNKILKEDEEVLSKSFEDYRSEENSLSDRKTVGENHTNKVSKKQKFVISLLLLHIGLQCFLPYSHFITKGYNNWVPGLYGYSWNMMVNYWDAITVVVQVRDNVNNEDFFINPHAYVGNNKWWKHGDMVKQYAHCLKDNLMREKQLIMTSKKRTRSKEKWERLSSDISIYVDVWCSLNGRFQQRMFKPNVDILTAEWHPFKPVFFLVPLLTKFNSYRHELEEIEKQVYTWSNFSDVYFVADYPEMQKLNFVDNELTNVTLTVIEGEISYLEEGKEEKVIIPKGEHFRIPSGIFHQIEVVSSVPACYMYTFVNRTEQFLPNNRINESPQGYSKLPTFENLAKGAEENIKAWIRALKHIKNAVYYLIFHNSFFNNCSVKRYLNLYQT